MEAKWAAVIVVGGAFAVFGALAVMASADYDHIARVEEAKSKTAVACAQAGKTFTASGDTWECK